MCGATPSFLHALNRSPSEPHFAADGFFYRPISLGKGLWPKEMDRIAQEFVPGQWNL